MEASSEARARRRAAAARYRPDHVRLLLVAEAPPAAEDRYFYFEQVAEQDALFRHVVQAVLGLAPVRAAKAAQLSALTDRGVFLIDLKEDAKRPGERLDGHVADLVRRAGALHPDHVITIKANVCDLCQGPLRDAGLPVVEERVPFPGSGRQREFLAAMHRALQTIGWAD